MSFPRWLKTDVVDGLGQLDSAWWETRKSGPLVVEIHYRSGQPMLVKLRDALLPPVMVEIPLCASTS